MECWSDVNNNERLVSSNTPLLHHSNLLACAEFVHGFDQSDHVVHGSLG
jgi:hypothetical protein